MKINFANLNELEKSDLIIVPAFEKVKNFGEAVVVINKLAPNLIKFAGEDNFDGKEGSVYSFRCDQEIRKVILLGLNSAKGGSASGGKKPNPNNIRKFLAQAVNLARQNHAKSLAVVLPLTKLNPKVLGQACAEGALLADYKYLVYKEEDRKKREEKPLEEVVLYHQLEKRSVDRFGVGINMGRVYAEATIFARELVNEPASTMTPTHLIGHAKEVAAQNSDRIKLEIFDQKALEKMGAGGILAIAKGSDEPAFMMHLVYTQKKSPSHSALRAPRDTTTLPLLKGGKRRRIAIVGKGITFDSGGLSLKPANGMEDMKIDMAGCATMLGVMSALAKLNLNVEVHGISAVCENMPSGKAVKPGDIVRSMNGKTIEILNTDAEGRVTLADTLHYATTLKPDAIIDLATLTGACVVALGEEVAGLMSNNRDLTAKLLASSGEADEMMWELPMPVEYKEQIKSKYADLKNIGGRYAGAITAGLFLEEFVGQYPWVHLDIAGPAWAESASNPLLPLGGTGFGVRTLLNYLEKL